MRALTVEITRPTADVLALRFLIEGELDALTIPAPAPPERTDELWRHTCLEAFVGLPQGYLEFNLSPSTAWAAYAFDGYRSGMRAAEVAPPGVEVARGARSLALSARLPLPPQALRLGLTAVMEAASGRLSYWSLRHPPGRPDFHHADGFALELPAPSGA